MGSTRRGQGRAGLAAALGASHRTARTGGTPSSRLGRRSMAAASVHSFAGTTVAAIHASAAAAASTCRTMTTTTVAAVQSSTTSVILSVVVAIVAILQVSVAVVAAVVAKAVVKAAAAAVITAVVVETATVAIIVVSATAAAASSLLSFSATVAAAVIHGSRTTAFWLCCATAADSCRSRSRRLDGASSIAIASTAAAHVFLGAPTLLTICLALGILSVATAGARSYALAMRRSATVAVGYLARIQYFVALAFVLHDAFFE